MVGSSFACHFGDHRVCGFDNSEISAVELGVLMLRVGSLRGWFTEFVKERKLEAGDKVYEELYLWLRAHELAGCCGQLGLGGGANLEHLTRVIQRFVDGVCKSVPVDWSNQKVFVTSFRAGDCNADGMLPVETRRNESSIGASDSNKWRGKVEASV